MTKGNELSKRVTFDLVGRDTSLKTVPIPMSLSEGPLLVRPNMLN